MSAPRVVQIYINEYRPAEGGVEWIVEIGVDPDSGAIEGEREFDAVGAAVEWAVKWLRDRGYDSELLIGFNAYRPAEPPIEDADSGGVR